ncbi:MAG: hypothetical protein OCU18_03715 [Candidatus Syntrophoarchaeum sp.]|nr:hypothetical protein [Candidatus Syntrophoarchaeum sp.]
MEYIKTDIPDIIKKIETVESEIHISKMETEIAGLKSQLGNIPEPKKEPDQETLEFWNRMNSELFNKEELMEELAEKEQLLAQLKAL